MLHHPCILGIPKQRGTKSELAASPLPSWGPKSGRNCDITPAFSGIPKQRGTKSVLAASPLPSWGPKCGRNCYITPAFFLRDLQAKGDKIGIGCLTPAFSGAQKRAEMLHNP